MTASDDPIGRRISTSPGRVSVTSAEARGALVESPQTGRIGCGGWCGIRRGTSRRSPRDCDRYAGAVAGDRLWRRPARSRPPASPSSHCSSAMSAVASTERRRRVKVDGESEPAHLVPTATGATLTLSRVGLSLADGPHRIEGRVIDRAGNATDAAPVDFGVDTALPSAQVSAPGMPSRGCCSADLARARHRCRPPTSTLSSRRCSDGVDITTALTFTSSTAPDGVVTLEGQGSDTIHSPRRAPHPAPHHRRQREQPGRGHLAVHRRHHGSRDHARDSRRWQHGGRRRGRCGRPQHHHGHALRSRRRPHRPTRAAGGVSVAGTINGSSWSCGAGERGRQQRHHHHH